MNAKRQYFPTRLYNLCLDIYTKPQPLTKNNPHNPHPFDEGEMDEQVR